jgi:hypothetical protein
MPIRRGGAGQGNQVGFLLPIQASGTGATERATGERRIQPLLRTYVSHPDNGWLAYLQRFADLGIRPAWAVFSRVSLEHDPSVHQPPGGLFACGDQVLQLLALCFGQAYDILFHEGLLVSV